MQRLYARAWRLAPLGMRATGWGLLWLAGFVAFVAGRNTVDGALSGPADVIVSLALSTLLWIVSPFVLLARRVPWRRLLPGALVTAVAMFAFSLTLVLASPPTFVSAASSYGMIGVAFAIVGWLVAAATVIMASAALGAIVGEERDDVR